MKKNSEALPAFQIKGDRLRSRIFNDLVKERTKKKLQKKQEKLIKAL